MTNALADEIERLDKIAIERATKSGRAANDYPEYNALHRLLDTHIPEILNALRSAEEVGDWKHRAELQFKSAQELAVALRVTESRAAKMELALQLIVTETCKVLELHPAPDTKGTDTCAALAPKETR